MMKPTFQLVRDSNPILREKMPSYAGSYEDIKGMLPDLFALMARSNGIGLAAPQVGLKMNFFIMDTAGRKRCVINPIIVEQSKAVCTFSEGCLSFPGKHIQISRPVQITAVYEDENGVFVTETMDGIAARCFQHETDHINGKVFTEYENA
jgi:peptide deformylase